MRIYCHGDICYVLSPFPTISSLLSLSFPQKLRCGCETCTCLPVITASHAITQKYLRSPPLEHQISLLISDLLSSAIYPLSLHISFNCSCCVFRSLITSLLIALLLYFIYLPLSSHLHPKLVNRCSFKRGLKGNRLPRQPLTLTGV